MSILKRYKNKKFKNITSEAKDQELIKTNLEELNKIEETNIEETNNDLPISEEVVRGISVKDGVIKVVSDEEVDDRISIAACKGINLFINDELCTSGRRYSVSSTDNIRYEPEIIEEDRECIIKVENNKMRAYITVKYKPQYTYKLIDQKIEKNLVLMAKKVKSKEATRYTINDLIYLLKIENIVYGINKNNLIEATKGDVLKPLLIAEGKPIIQDIPSRVKILFKEDMKRKVDDNAKIDYREMFVIQNVSKGEVIAEIIPRIEGEDGINVYGETLNRNTIRDIPVRADKNCHIEGSNIIADVSGKPSYKNNIISVFNSYELTDIDLSTGNVDFKGDVIVGRDIKEGMVVKAGNSLVVGGNVYSAVVISNGEANIYGNVIDSQVLSGAVDVNKRVYIEQLYEFKEKIQMLIELSEKIINETKSNKSFAEVIELIIDNRIKQLPKMALNLISFNITREIKVNPLIEFLRNKFLGINITNLNNTNDLRYLLRIIDDEIEYWNGGDIMPININLKYIQNSKIKATGNVIFNGAGEYNSRIHALGDVIFTSTMSTARGGSIIAGNNITLGRVGSLGNVITRLEVSEKGKITANVVFPNTIIKIGPKEKVIEELCRNFEAHLDEDGQISIISSPM